MGRCQWHMIAYRALRDMQLLTLLYLSVSDMFVAGLKLDRFAQDSFSHCRKKQQHGLNSAQNKLVWLGSHNACQIIMSDSWGDISQSISASKCPISSKAKFIGNSSRNLTFGLWLWKLPQKEATVAEKVGLDVGILVYFQSCCKGMSI